MLARKHRAYTFGAFASIFVLTASLATAQQNDAVARVNGVDVTAQDYAVAEEMYGQQLGKMPEDAKRSTIVDALIELRLMSEAARKSGIQDDEEYKRQIAFFEAQTLRSIFMQRELSKRVDDGAVRKAYDEQVAKMPVVEETRLRHMLLPTAEAADVVIADLKAGKDFSAIAKEKSADPASKEKGGDLGFLTPGQTLLEIESAAAELKAGQFSETPVKSAFGFHVVKVDERRPRAAPRFELLAGEIRQALEAEEAARILSDLRSGAKVEKLVPDVQAPEGEDGHPH